MKLKSFNIAFGAMLMSFLISEMTLASVFQFYVVRFLQIFIVINIFYNGFRIFKKAVVFIIPSLIFILFGIFFFKESAILSDFFNLIWWFTFMMIMNYSISDHESFERFKRILFKATFILTTISASIGLVKLFLISRGTILPFMEVTLANGNDITLLGSSLNIDYNVYSIGLFCGVFATLFCYRKATSMNARVLYSICILIILSSAMFSSSRRGLIIGLIIILFLIIWSNRNIKWLKRENLTLKTNFFKSPLLIIMIVLFFIASAINFNKIIESSAEITSLYNRLETINALTSEENDSRLNRWGYALEYYSELPILSKLFGDGFSYLGAFGSKFRQSDIDHPHNVWISSLLYGGVLGFIATLWLTAYVLKRLYKLRMIFSELFLWYVLFLILNFTSSNTIFSSRIFVVLLLVPFLDFSYRQYIKLNINKDSELTTNNSPSEQKPHSMNV